MTEPESILEQEIALFIRQRSMSLDEHIAFKEKRRELRARQREAMEDCACGYCDEPDEFEGYSDAEISEMAMAQDGDNEYRLMSRTEGIFKIARGSPDGRDYVGFDEYGMHHYFCASSDTVRKIQARFQFENSNLVEMTIQDVAALRKLGATEFVRSIEKKEEELEEFQNRRFVDNRKRKDKTNIYLMEDGHTGFIKIGRSKNPSTRERTLQAQVPLLRMMWTCSGINSDEKILHDMFAKKRLRGEWFDLNESDVEYIKSLDWRK
jgi:hypothetical protein